jgi:hypothetical protein
VGVASSHRLFTFVVENAIKEDATTMAFFRALMQCIMGDGTSMLFWIDPWLDGDCIQDLTLTSSRQWRHDTRVAGWQARPFLDLRNMNIRSS